MNPLNLNNVGVLVTGLNAQVQVTQILGNAVHYQQLQARFDKLEQQMTAKSYQISKMREAGFADLLEDLKSELLDISTDRNQLEREMQSFREDVRRLVETFERIDPKEGLLADAQRLFFAGDIKGANTLLDADAMRRNGNALLEKQAHHQAQLAQTQIDLQTVAQQFLVKAQATRLDCDNPKRYIECQSYFEESLRCTGFGENHFEYAQFLQEQHLFEKVAFHYTKAASFASSVANQATILNNLGNYYYSTQNMLEAENNYKKALEIRRTLAEQNPIFLSDVATSLNNLGIFYRANQKMLEAEAAFDESLKYYSDLADKDRDTFLPDVAMVLNNLGNYYYVNNNMQKAENTYETTLKYYSYLVAKNKDAFLPDVAMTLNNLGALHNTNKKILEAEKTLEEALNIRRILVDKNPAAFLPYLTSTLNNLGAFYRMNQKMLEAEAAYEEALKHSRALAVKNSEAFLNNVAMTLNNLGNFHLENRNWVASRNAYKEAFAIYRDLAAQKNNAFLPYVAATSINLSTFYLEAEPNQAKSLAYAHEAMQACEPFPTVPSIQGYMNKIHQIINYWENQNSSK